MPHGGCFKMGHIFRYLPGDGIMAADDPVGGHGGDNDQFHDVPSAKGEKKSVNRPGVAPSFLKTVRFF
jgi:hypothetical protein